MFGKLFIGVFAVLSLQSGAQPFSVIYGFANVGGGTGTVSPGPLPQQAGLSLNSFSAFGVSGQPTAAGRFSFDEWGLGAINGSDDYALYTGSLDPFRYYETRIDVSPGYTLELSEMSFTMRRSTTGVRHFCVRASQDNFTANLTASTGTNANLSVVENNVFFWNFDSLTSTAEQKGCMVTFSQHIQPVTGFIRLRFYAWNAESAGGNFSIDNVELSGVLRDSTTWLGVEEVGQTGSSGVPVTLCLYTAAGLMIRCAGNREELFREQLAEGLYFLFLRKEGRSYLKKIVVTH